MYGRLRDDSFSASSPLLNSAGRTVNGADGQPALMPFGTDMALFATAGEFARMNMGNSSGFGFLGAGSITSSRVALGIFSDFIEALVRALIADLLTPRRLPLACTALLRASRNPESWGYRTRTPVVTLASALFRWTLRLALFRYEM